MSQNLNIPAGYQAVMPYLMIKNAPAFMTFLKEVFEAEEKMKVMNDDGSLMHGEVLLNGAAIMIAEGSEQWGYQNAGLFVYVADADTTYEKAIEAGSTSVMPMENKDYGRTGGVKDPYGNTWWITANNK